MTEKEAWLFLAEEFTLGRETSDGYMSSNRNHGLCTAVIRLADGGHIARETKEKMLLIIDELPDYDEEWYKWPRSLEGAKQRIAFCREQYEDVPDLVDACDDAKAGG